MATPLKKYEIKIDLYGDTVILHIGSGTEYNKILATDDLKPLDPDAIGHSTRLYRKNKKGQYVGYWTIWLYKFKGTPKCFQILVHEIAHVALMIMEHRGLPIDIENTETVAHLQGYITERFIEKIRGKKRRCLNS